MEQEIVCAAHYDTVTHAYENGVFFYKRMDWPDEWRICKSARFEEPSPASKKR
jgi:hypothetical protein